MVRDRIPLTRDNYLRLDDPGTGEKHGAEYEAMMPRGMQLDEHGNDPTKSLLDTKQR